MKNQFKLTSMLFLLAGMALITVSFFLFLKGHQEEDLFYLNLVVSNLVYVIAFFQLFDMTGTTKEVAHTSSSLGMRWLALGCYTPLSIVLIVGSILFGWTFNFCLIGHLMLLFTLLMFFFFGTMVTKNEGEVMEEVQARRTRLQEIKNQIDILEMQCKLASDQACLEMVATLRENVHFITGSDNPMAIAIEDKLMSHLHLITMQIEKSSQPVEVITKGLNDCITLTELRKNHN